MIQRTDTLRDQAYRLIREKIIRQELLFGERLSVAKLSREFGISNSPIREAISLLETDGLVENRPNYGFHVIDFNDETFHDLAQSIHVLLSGCYDEIIRRGYLDDLTIALEEAFKIQSDNFHRDFDYEYVCIAIDFDRCFVEATKNDMLSNLFDGLFNLLVLCTLSAYTSGDDGVKENLEEHRAILAAVKNRDHELVKDLLDSHYDKSDLPLFRI